MSALEATTDYIRRYKQYFLALQEQHGPEAFNHEAAANMMNHSFKHSIHFQS